MECICIHTDNWQFDCYNNVSIQVDLKLMFYQQEFSHYDNWECAIRIICLVPCLDIVLLLLSHLPV